jgi:hypothetical protein
VDIIRVSGLLAGQVLLGCYHAFIRSVISLQTPPSFGRLGAELQCGLWRRQIGNSAFPAVAQALLTQSLGTYDAT